MRELVVLGELRSLTSTDRWRLILARVRLPVN
jgi:hypothetical protein